jgi:hypothetical protein
VERPRLVEENQEENHEQDSNHFTMKKKEGKERKIDSTPQWKKEKEEATMRTRNSNIEKDLPIPQ